jgi:acid phosphatase (class A)
MSPVIKNIKYKFNRPRPYQLASIYNIEINAIMTKTHRTPSYPSGHTAYAALGAYILSAKYPKYSSDFFSKVSLAGMARMLQGVHYPSDNEAAMIISGAIWEDIRYSLFPELKNF